MKFIKTIFQLSAAYLQKFSPLAGIPVLMYHSVSAEPSTLSLAPDQFEEQLKFLKSSGYQSLTPEGLSAHLSKRQLPQKKVVLTFDDGFKDNFDNALPLLKKYGFNAIFFINTKYLGQPASAICSDPVDQQRALMTGEHLVKMAKDGFVVANHFYSHTPLIQLSPDQIKDEYRRNFDALQAILGSLDSLSIVAYPKNKTNSSIIELLPQLGIQLAFGGGNRMLSLKANRFNLPRIDVLQLKSFTAFRAKLSPYSYLLKL